MSDRRISILVDGGFFLKRLRKLVAANRCEAPDAIIGCLKQLFRTHVKMLTGGTDADPRWHRHIYRNFYYDAQPFDGKAHHPIDNKAIDFAKSDLAKKRLELFHHLRRMPKLALRLGKVSKDADWVISASLTKKVLQSKSLVTALEALGPADGSPSVTTLTLSEKEAAELRQLRDFWKEIESGAVSLGLRQKGVDMRIGLDISTLTLKKQVDTIVLVAGDSDFVPAAKLARREGVQVILDPLWQQVNDDLYEHIDGLQSGLPRPADPNATSASSTAPSAPPT